MDEGSYDLVLCPRCRGAEVPRGSLCNVCTAELRGDGGAWVAAWQRKGAQAEAAPPQPGPQLVLAEILAELLLFEARHMGRAGADWRAEALALIARGYRLIGPPLLPVAIQCLRCGLTSYNPSDVERRYCGFCKRFHEGEQR
jgi:hypothetical protein